MRARGMVRLTQSPRRRGLAQLVVRSALLGRSEGCMVWFGIVLRGLSTAADQNEPDEPGTNKRKGRGLRHGNGRISIDVERQQNTCCRRGPRRPASGANCMQS